MLPRSGIQSQLTIKGEFDITEENKANFGKMNPLKRPFVPCPGGEGFLNERRGG